jgi:hypothetical protein
MKKILISFPNGGCGNLIAGLVYCLQTNNKLLPNYTDGSMHVENLWQRVDTIDKHLISNSHHNIFITHGFVDNSFNNLATIVRLKYKHSSKDLIKKLSINKNLKGTLNWLNSCNEHPATVEQAIDSITKSIDWFLDVNQFEGRFVNFEDIWNKPTQLLADLSRLIDLPVTNGAINLLESYRQINSKLYNIKLN